MTTEGRFWKSQDGWDPEMGGEIMRNMGPGGNKVALDKAMALLEVSPPWYPLRKDLMTLRLSSLRATCLLLYEPAPLLVGSGCFGQKRTMLRGCWGALESMER